MNMKLECLTDRGHMTLFSVLGVGFMSSYHLGSKRDSEGRNEWCDIRFGMRMAAMDGGTQCVKNPFSIRLSNAWRLNVASPILGRRLRWVLAWRLLNQTKQSTHF